MTATPCSSHPPLPPSTSSTATWIGAIASPRRCGNGSAGGAHVTQTARPATIPEDEGGRGLAARVNLGRIFTPISSEFALISSTALLLTIFGLVMVLSATSAIAVDGGEGPYSIVIKQGLFALVGVPL